MEFAFASMFFFVTVLALIDFTRLAFTAASLAEAAGESARSLAIPSTTNAAGVDSFDRHLLILGAQNTGSVTVSVYDASAQRVGTRTCSLPLTAASCALPARTSNGTTGTPYTAGYVDVRANYTFAFGAGIPSLFGTSYSLPSVNLSVVARQVIG